MLLVLKPNSIGSSSAAIRFQPLRDGSREQAASQRDFSKSNDSDSIVFPKSNDSDPIVFPSSAVNLPRCCSASSSAR